MAGHLLHFLVFIISAETLAAVFFLKRDSGRILLLNCASVLMILVPESLRYRGHSSPFLDVTAVVGTALFPAVFSMIIKRFVKIKSGPSPVVALAAGGAVLAVSLFSADLRIALPASLLALFSMYMLYLLFNGLFSSKNTYALLMVGLAANLGLSVVSAARNSMFYYAVSTAVLFILTSFFLAIGFTNRVGRLSTHLKKLEDLNRQFIHTATRLRLKVEQLKRVVQEKELELFQMSKHASLAEITTGIAHELTQPLTGIKGIAQNMVDDINNDEFDNLQAVAELLKISFLVDKSSSIIDHIRNFSKKNDMNMQFIDLNKVILNAVDLINLQFKKYNIDIVLILDDHIKKVYGDAISLEQLIINLLLNSRDAILERRKAEYDGYNGKISIFSDYTGDEVRITIDDNGTGISSDIIKKIWSPFFTTKRRGSSTGIGLSISKKILKEHNAKVSLASVPGTGTTFTLLFPAKRENQAIAVS